MNRSLAVLISVFFFWGFFAAGNGIFIGYCKGKFQLDQFQSQLIDYAFYGAYFIGALILFIISSLKGKDLMNSWGFKNGIIYGLVISTIGALSMVIAFNMGIYGGILASLFIIALGFSLQQTSANPFVLNLGDSNTSSQRLSLAGGINSLGTTLAPIIVSFILFGKASATAEEKLGASLTSMNFLYIGIAILFIGVAVLFRFSKSLPNLKDSTEFEKSPKAMIVLLFLTIVIIVSFAVIISSYKGLLPDQKLSQEIVMQNGFILSCVFGLVILTLLSVVFFSKKNPEGWGAMKHSNLTLGMLAIFFYVGVEVSIQSNLSSLLKLPEFGEKTDTQFAPFSALYWGSLMIGRWAGALKVFKLDKMIHTLFLVIVPYIAFAIVLLANTITGNDIGELTYYAFVIPVLIIGFLLSKDNPKFTLLLFSVFGMIAMIIGIITTGTISTYAFLSGGLFCSIMWPCIFDIATKGLGKYTSQGSSFLIMMILGGAIIPPLQGLFADIETIGIHQSYVVTVICFAYLAVYTLVSWKSKETI